MSATQPNAPAAAQAAPIPSSGVLPLVAQRRVLITVGSGGVGKTTTAAALGLMAARLGRRSLVMTIDPARRLATSLGLQSLDSEQRVVPAEKMAAAGLPGGLLHAMMLEQKAAFDEMVRRYAPDAEAAERLRQSRIYQQLSSRLAGSQEYAAMEKLHALHEDGRFELLVLDTPPTANALDFLEAPQKMVDAVESPAVHLFVSAYRRAGRISLSALGFSAAYIVRRLARFTGGQFLDDIAHFLADLSGLLGGMRDRAAAVMELLRRPEVGFIIVTGPDPRAIDEAIVLHSRLVEARLSPAAFVVNKVHPLRPVEASLGEVRERLARVVHDATVVQGLAVHLLDAHARMQGLARADAAQVQRLYDLRPDADYPLVQIPLFNEDIFDVAGLMKLADRLA